MTDGTEQKILNAALKIFSKKGYEGAKTAVIAEEAGFSEKTLFRKFKTKENLFNEVISTNDKKLKEDFEVSVLLDMEFENSREFLDLLIKNLAKLVENHIDYVYLSFYEVDRISGNVATVEIVPPLSEYVANNLQNKKINPYVFVLTILSFLSNLYVYDKLIEHAAVDREKTIEGFINNLSICA